MQQLLQKNKSKVFWSLFLIGLLICIRLFEDNLFYDPFLAYFKSEYAHTKLPQFNVFKLFFSLGIRFYLNSVISLFLLYVIFKDTKIVKFSMLLYMILGSILMISFIFVLTFFGEENKMTLFYIRRFLIQPIFIMLFIPAFYYQKQVRK
ncbi:exosortase F system-associated membrane protein [Flavobacterium sp.]|uniref:exosortase F system-associated membrane protein n=1 Tax=Flavobacterium sp. TaxID=239 RepID=UPI00391B0A58